MKINSNNLETKKDLKSEQKNHPNAYINSLHMSDKKSDTDYFISPDEGKEIIASWLDMWIKHLNY